MEEAAATGLGYETAEPVDMTLAPWHCKRVLMVDSGCVAMSATAPAKAPPQRFLKTSSILHFCPYFLNLGGIYFSPHTTQQLQKKRRQKKESLELFR